MTGVWFCGYCETSSFLIPEESSDSERPTSTIPLPREHIGSICNHQVLPRNGIILKNLLVK